MKYNFDQVIDRRGTNCVKWDEEPPVSSHLVSRTSNLVSMWIADMDFAVCPAIIDALKKRLEHPVFGYTEVPQSYYDAVKEWNQRRHNWTVERQHIIYTSGVVPAISACIKAVTLPGDKVLVQTPVYNCFFSSIRNQGCTIEESPLIYNASLEKDSSLFTLHSSFYEVDFDAFERRCADPKVKAFILCNPHNPAGRVWTREELQRLGEICLKHDVFVISDEIHCEIVMPGYKYTPFASISEEFANNCAVCIAPTKAFNIAGLQIANIVVKNPRYYERIDRAINIHENCDVNPFGVLALEAAYKEGEPWLQEMIQYVWENYQFLCQYLSEKAPQLTVTKLEGTYLVWVNISKLGIKAADFCTQLLEKENLWLASGEVYGETTGSDFVRINIACPRKTLQEGLERLVNALS